MLTHIDLAGAAYEIATEGGTWQGLCEVIADRFDTIHTLISMDIEDRGGGWAYSNTYLATLTEPHWISGEDPLIERAWKLPRGRMSVVQRMDQDPFFVNSAFYRTHLADNRLAHTVHVMLPTGPGRVSFFCMTRASGQPPFSDAELGQLEAFLPHLTRAIKVAERAGASQRSMIDAMPYGIAFIDAAGKAQDMNLIARRLVAAADGVSMVNGIFRFEGVHSDLARLMAERQASGQGGSTAFAIERRRSDRPLSGLLQWLPRNLACRPEEGATAAILVLSDPASSTYPQAGVLMDEFGLTQSEARFAQTLVRGRSLGNASIELGISPETGRRHVKSIFEKTGTHSQAELIHLLVRHPSALFGLPI